MRRLVPALLLPLAACATLRPATGPTAPPENGWRLVATANDRERLREWREAFVDALADARADGHAAEIAAQGALLEPDAALAAPPIPNGDYRCRVIKLGAKSEGMLSYIAYPYFTCRIRQHGAIQHFEKLTGSQRQVGHLYPGDALRQVFLGTIVLGDETQALRYGTDRERNVAGWAERIGPSRWRIVMPRPHFESKTDVLELVPAS